jgi:hypothetical protein
MDRTLRNSAIALALIGAAAIAATPALALHLRDRDRTIIYETIINEKEPILAPPPAGWHAQVGLVVPNEVELFDVPAVPDVPSIGGYRYTVVDNDVVLVDPITGQVAEVIEPD